MYVVIAQPMSRVLALREALLRRGCLANTVIVAADAAASPGMRYLAPYAGATVAEWFRDQGGHALVVYDDLTKHADAYRELALLLDRPPGREAYPGDVFYLHAELLERAAACRPAAGGGSVTALPIIETTEGDLAAYIPTNVISITDGQIHLDTGRFERNERPAVDVGRSVSRIGGAAQPPAMRRVASDLRVRLARFEQLEALVRVGLEVDADVEREITRGRLLRALLRQGQAAPRGIAEQVVGLLAVGRGLARPRSARGRGTRRRALPRPRPRAPAGAGRAARGRRGTGGRMGGEPARSGARAARGGDAVSREGTLRQRLQVLGTLHEAVNALRSLSAHHFRSARAALPAARAYRAEIESVMGVLPGATLSEVPGGAPPAIVLVAADLGLCGDYAAGSRPRRWPRASRSGPARCGASAGARCARSRARG